MSLPDIGDSWTEEDWAEFARANGYTLEEARAAVAKHNARTEPPYWWEEIQRVLDKRRRRPRSMPKPDDPPGRCPTCGKPMRWIYWQNDTPPEWMCGCGGFVEICAKCREWGRFFECWIS